MASPLLQTKFHVPRRRRGVVERQRLLERLDLVTESTLTLVSAPAGFGKSTLLTEWVVKATAGRCTTAWLSLDQRDSDPGVFWRYVIGALQMAEPDVGAVALAMLESAQSPVEAVLASLLNDLDSIAGDIVLVLDDYHVIEAHEVHDAMAFLVEHLPPHVHLVICSRADPALPLARLRARGELVELRAADLRFTPGEATAYLNGVMGLDLSQEAVVALDGRAEGWIAALQLAALSMQGRDDTADFIAGFAGDDRYIVDYLVGEVLQRQPEQVRTFLLQTSVLTRLSGPLCDAVTGQEGGQAMLDSLERANLFLVPLDDRRHWYRYHHLFADVLRARLAEERPHDVGALHRRAADWFEEHGERSEAIRHAMAAEDFVRAAELVELAGPAMRQGRHETILRRWLEALPDELIERRPVLAVSLVGARMSTGELAGAVGLEVPSGSIVIAPSTVVTAFVVGTAITVISALWPAVRSSRVRPIAALRDVAIDVSGSSVARTGAGVAVLALGMGAFTAGILNVGPALALIGFGTLATIIGVFVLGPVIARPLMGVLGTPVEAMAGTTGRLARENVKRNPKRTSATASALMIGVTLVGFITILASSFKASISDTLAESLQADYVVASGSLGAGGLSPEIEADLAALPEVSTVSPARSTAVEVGGASSEVAAVDIQTIGRVADVGVTAGRLADLSGASIAVEDRKAKADGLAVGDTVTVTFARTGAVELTVRALIDRPPPGFDGVVYVVGLDTYKANVTDQFDRQVFVKVADGVSPAQAEAALETVLARWPNGELQDQAAFEKSVASQIDIILNLIYGLLGLAIVIALIGIANTLALSVHERRRELGLLRAVGMTRPQVRSAIRWESVMIALMGTFLGFVLAVGGAWGIISAIPGDRPIPLSVPPVQLTVIVVMASVAGVLAAVGPARRAAKLDILDAIASH